MDGHACIQLGCNDAHLTVNNDSTMIQSSRRDVALLRWLSDHMQAECNNTYLDVSHDRMMPQPLRGYFALPQAGN